MTASTKPGPRRSSTRPDPRALDAPAPPHSNCGSTPRHSPGCSQPSSPESTPAAIPNSLTKHPTARIDRSARLDFGDGGAIRLDAHAEIRAGAHLEVYDDGLVQLGRRVVVGVNNWFQGNGDITIGDDSILGPGVVLASTDHQMDLALPILDQPLSKRPINIGRDVWIGANTTIAAGVTIADHAVIGANSFVNRDVPARAIVAGAPARPIGQRQHVPPQRTLLFAIALGITDRPERWGAISRFFAIMGNTLREAGIDSWYICHSNASRPLERVRSDRRIIRDGHADFENLLERIKPDLIFIWNGASEGDLETRRFADARNIPCRFGELGWFPQSSTLYFDAEGTNARSSIRRLDLSKTPVDPRLDEWLRQYQLENAHPRPDPEPYILVPLQDERDLNITLASPYPAMARFVADLAARFPRERFIVRPHPQFRNVSLGCHPNVTIRSDGPIHAWLAHADAVVAINSTALLEALAHGRPAHSLGTGLWSGLDVLHESADAGSMTLHKKIDPARADRTRRFLSELIFTRQTRRKDLHYLDRLSAAWAIADLLPHADHDAPRARRT